MNSLTKSEGLPLASQEPGVDQKHVWVSLLGNARKAMAEGVEIRIPPQSIRPMPGQPRVYFNPDSIQRLATSMKAIGQIVPGIVRKIPREGDVEYELLDGERRWRGTILGELLYRATLVDIQDEAIPLIIAAVANFNREGHTPTEISDSIERMRTLHIPMEEIADILGITTVWAYQIHSLQKLHPEVREMLDPNLQRDQQLPVTAAIQISRIDPKFQVDLAKRVLSKEVSVRGVRSEVIKVAHAAGLQVRVHEREPRRLWESIDSLSTQVNRTAKDLENLLREQNLVEVFKDRPSHQVWLILGRLEEARDACLRGERLIEKVRPK